MPTALSPKTRTPVKAELRKFGKEIPTLIFLVCGRLGEQLDGRALRIELQAALWAPDAVGAMEEELAADEALEARAAEDRDQLLVERPVQTDHRHSERNTPITLPRI
jgi:hypothetical protein